MLKIQFISMGYVGRAIYAENITINGTQVLDRTYLASSQVEILSDDDQGDGKPVNVEALVPTWLIRNKIQEYKNLTQDASQDEIAEIMSLVAING
jgi:hypothetical protein